MKSSFALGIITAACILLDCIEPIRTDHFIKLYKMGQRQTKRALTDQTYLYDNKIKLENVNSLSNVKMWTF